MQAWLINSFFELKKRKIIIATHTCGDERSDIIDCYDYFKFDSHSIIFYGIFFLIKFDKINDIFNPKIDCAIPETGNFLYGEK